MKKTGIVYLYGFDSPLRGQIVPERLQAATPKGKLNWVPYLLDRDTLLAAADGCYADSNNEPDPARIAFLRASATSLRHIAGTNKVVHLTLTGFQAGRPLCDCDKEAERALGNEFKHAQCMDLRRLDICPACLKAWYAEEQEERT